MKLRNGLSGLDGDEVARQRVEEFANKMRPTGFLVCFALSTALARSLTGRFTGPYQSALRRYGRVCTTPIPCADPPPAYPRLGIGESHRL